MTKEATMKIYYEADDGCGPYQFELKNEKMPSTAREWRRLVEDLAEHYHFEHGGRERSWPFTIELFESDDCDGHSLGKWSVDREARPVFIASRIAGEVTP